MEDFSKKTNDQNRDNYFFWAILAICILIIGESVWVVNKFVSQTSFSSPTEKVKELVQPQAEKSKEVEISLQGESQIAVNELTELRLKIKGLQEGKILGADFVLNYDPELVKIVDQDATKAGTQVKTFETGLGEVARNLVEEEKGRIVISLVNLNEEGAAIKQDEEFTLATIGFVPLAEKDIKFAFQLADNEEIGTKIVKAETVPAPAILNVKNYYASVVKAVNNSAN